MPLEPELVNFCNLVLSELRYLRQEVSELRRFLETKCSSASELGSDQDREIRVSADKPEPSAAWRDIFVNVPPALSKRLNSLLTMEPSTDPRELAVWLLEISENVEDFLRYEGEDWQDAAIFLERLQQLEARHGLQRLLPQEGDMVDSRLHLILQSIPNAEKRDLVARCARPGFLYAGEILRRSEVVVYL